MLLVTVNTHKTTTVILTAHARRGLLRFCVQYNTPFTLSIKSRFTEAPLSKGHIGTVGGL